MSQAVLITGVVLAAGPATITAGVAGFVGSIANSALWRRYVFTS